MLNFESDYTEGAHEAILRRLVETNYEQLTGYGNDIYCQRAKEKIKAACGRPDAQVFLTVGGTQTNQLVIDTVLANYQGVISADTGHINGHEAGAIEHTGHKVLAIPHVQGKLMAADVEKYLALFYENDSHDHMVFPGMVYISHPTEFGTLYTLEELTALSRLCRKHGLPLYLDGARLGYGLMSAGTDVALRDIADLCDAFYIGGTKVGALCGEAVVFTHGNAPAHFFTGIKQHGALLAKGRLLGVQFDALFTDGLYFEISRHAIAMADRLRAILTEKGYRFHIPTVTNQVFVVLTNGQDARLKKQLAYSFWERLDDDHIVVRLATSWATKAENVEALAQLL